MHTLVTEGQAKRLVEEARIANQLRLQYPEMIDRFAGEDWVKTQAACGLYYVRTGDGGLAATAYALTATTRFAVRRTDAGIIGAIVFEVKRPASAMHRECLHKVLEIQYQATPKFRFIAGDVGEFFTVGREGADVDPDTFARMVGNHILLALSREAM
jgi:hypothetical protein